MKFHLAINMERADNRVDMREVARHTLDMVQLAETSGFDIVWAAEHHALEMTIAPNPFQILTWWAMHTDRIRLGTAVLASPYWHPIRAAGEAAMLDVLSGGRLEFGVGSGAYQREFDRMRPGVKQTDGWRYMNELLPAVRALWQGDYAHDGEYWTFPTATSVPKPLQKPYPPAWVAARSPVSYDYAVEHECNVLAWPLTRPYSEVEAYLQRLQDAMAAHPQKPRPQVAMMRHTAVYEKQADWQSPVDAIIDLLGRFENLFQNLGGVSNGFPAQVDWEKRQGQYEPEALSENLMFGTPDQVIDKIKRYQASGVDAFVYYANMGWGMAEQKRSMTLFCREVLPAFAD